MNGKETQVYKSSLKDMSFQECMREKKSPYTPQDIARLINVDRSTVSRFWNNPEWIEHVKGSTLVSLTNIIPGLQDCVEERFFYQHAEKYREDFQQMGIILSELGLHELFSLYGNSVFIEMMEILHAIMHSDNRKLQKLLVSAWNFRINGALAMLFSDAKIIVNTDFFYEQCIILLKKLNFESNILIQVLPQTIIAHHILRANNDLGEANIVGKRHISSFVLRSLAMGSIIGDNDLSVLERYHKQFLGNSLLHRIEQWSYASYYGDIKTKSSFSIPQKLRLEQSYTKLFADLLTKGDAYKNYLWAIQLPTLMQIDPLIQHNKVKIESTIMRVLEHETDRNIIAAGMKCLALAQR